MKSKRVHCTPKNLDVPPKMKVKGYMYPQMKKPVGMLLNNKTRPGSVLVHLYNQNNKAITFKLYNHILLIILFVSAMGKLNVKLMFIWTC